jgi:hypothetical protein
MMSPPHLDTRRSPLSPSRTLFIGREVHNDARAVADVAQAHGAEVTSLGTLGTPQCAIAQRIRQRPAKATPLVFGYAAGPCGSWRSRSLTTKAYDCWAVAPSLLPKRAGDRVTTDRRDAVPLARLARAGARTAGDVPTGEDDALRDLTRAREEAISDGTDATFRRKAVWRRHALRATGRANGHPAHLRWLSAVLCPTPAQPLVLHE